MRLHPKYGVNPTVAVCSWCKEDTGEVVLLGASYKEEAPHRMVVSKEPCDKCRAMMDRGVTLIEVKCEPPHGEEPERTGRWCVITHGAAERIFNVKIEKAAYLLPEVYEHLGLHEIAPTAYDRLKARTARNEEGETKEGESKDG